MTRGNFLRLVLISILVIVLDLGAQAQGLPLFTHHVREVTLDGQAALVGHLPASRSMRLVFVLPLRNRDGLNRLLHQLYDPASPLFRRFLTVEEFTAQFGPTQQDYDAVIRFARTNGLEVVATSRNRVNIDIEGSVANIERTLHLTIDLYQDSTENRTFYAPDREPTPDLRVRLWHISGLDNYSIPRPALVHRNAGAADVEGNSKTGSGPGGSFLGSDMRAAYYGGTLTGSGQSLGLLEYLGTDLSDLNTYYANVGQTNNVPITLLSTDGTPASCVSGKPGCDDIEQTIDMTQALGMAPGLAGLVMYVGSSDTAIFNAMATGDPLCAQLSSSWEWSPADPNTDDPYFEEFAAQGQNLFEAAGDEAEWTTSLLRKGAMYPSDSPYITSVGGTDLKTKSAGGGWSSETAWLYSGGGISPEDFVIPSWQVATASTCSNCSQSYRNGPDVAANANTRFYACANQKLCTTDEGGTSFAAPMWAGYLALVNEQAISNNGQTVGFINPFLYSIGLGSSYDSDFHDIISGCQKGEGFCATVGYDLVTGWGSPNGSALIDALAAPPPPGFSIYASPRPLTAEQGSSAQSVITTTVVSGFDSAIALTATGQPTGVTISFNPNSITGAGAATMTMAVASSTPIGTYGITVNGSSASTVQTTTVWLNVESPPHLHVGHSY
jgi:subtilase family serine protease